MINNVTLWVQSRGLDEPDLLSVNGERILPKDNLWQSTLSYILNDNIRKFRLTTKEHFSLYRAGNKYIIKGVLSQKDRCDRHLVFTAQIQSNSIKSSLSRLKNELALYNLSYSEKCQKAIKSFLVWETFLVIAVCSIFILMAILLFVYHLIN